MVCALSLTCLMFCGSADADDNWTGFTASGTASWFGEWHHGKYTASGEPFDMYAMTAAHKQLPFGTVLQVTNTSNGKVVVVRVNDRGPFRKARILDLSFAAADRLGMRVSGIAPVVLTVVGDTQGRPLQNSQAFFVRLEDKRNPNSTLLQTQLSRLIKVGVQDAASLLHTADHVAALGPYETFQAAEEALVRVATTHPKAAIMLADKDAARPLVSSVAMGVAQVGQGR